MRSRLVWRCCCLVPCFVGVVVSCTALPGPSLPLVPLLLLLLVLDEELVVVEELVVLLEPGLREGVVVVYCGMA